MDERGVKSSAKSSKALLEAAAPTTSFNIMEFVMPLDDSDIFNEMGVSRAAPVQIPLEAPPKPEATASAEKKMSPTKPMI